MGLRQMLPVQTKRRFRIGGTGPVIDSHRPAAAAGRMLKNCSTGAYHGQVCTAEVSRAGRFHKAA